MRTLVWSVLVVVAAAGCGGEERLYHVAGTVTFDGKPVPKGVIFFDPVGTGPQGFASIENGRFDTAQPNGGRGVRAGPHAVRVGGYDGKPGNEQPLGNALFPEFTATREFPPADSSYDVDVPKPGKRK
jgi:hypothetical protein